MREDWKQNTKGGRRGGINVRLERKEKKLGNKIILLFIDRCAVRILYVIVLYVLH